MLHYTILSYRNNFLPGRYGGQLFRPTKIFLDENRKPLKKIIFFEMKIQN